MEKIKIMIADDESRMRKLVRDFLVKRDYEVVEAEDGQQAVDMFFDDKDIALIILDVMMPKMDGWEVIKEIRQYSDVPIMYLSAKGEQSDEEYGLKLGADDYVSKPFSLQVLLLRMENILKRNNTIVAEGEKLEAGGIVIDKAAHTVAIDGNDVELSLKEFELLTYFLENQSLALSREKILNHVWDYAYYGDARTIDTHVKKLRSKMGDKGDYIKTIRGMGYKFEV